MDAQNARRVSVRWFTGDATDVSGLRSSLLLIRTIPGFRCERLHTFRRQIGVRIGPVPPAGHRAANPPWVAPAEREQGPIRRGLSVWARPVDTSRDQGRCLWVFCARTDDKRGGISAASATTPSLR